MFRHISAIRESRILYFLEVMFRDKYMPLFIPKNIHVHISPGQRITSSHSSAPQATGPRISLYSLPLFQHPLSVLQGFIRKNYHFNLTKNRSSKSNRISVAANAIDSRSMIYSLNSRSEKKWGASYPVTSPAATGLGSESRIPRTRSEEAGLVPLTTPQRA